MTAAANRIDQASSCPFNVEPGDVDTIHADTEVTLTIGNRMSGGANGGMPGNRPP